jgi:hypothetical protein
VKRTALVALIVLVPAGAFAQMAANQGRSTNFEFALRGAYALPFGKSTDTAGDDLSQFISHDVPLTVDLNYRFSEEVLAGVYFSYGFSSLGDPLARACPSGASCSARTLRVGLGAYYHFKPRNKYDPWLGGSLGYEQAKASGPSGDATIWGLEWLNLQFGLDYHVSPLFAVGPLVSAGFGSYTHVDAGSTSGSIANTAIHGWFAFGARISFTP